MRIYEQYFYSWCEPHYNNAGVRIHDSIIKQYLLNNEICSLELNVPNNVNLMCLRDDPNYRIPPRTMSIPSGIQHLIVKFGFVNTNNARGFVRAERRYVLRNHDFPITIDNYKMRILPHLRLTVNRRRIFMREVFNNALPYARNRYNQDLARRNMMRNPILAMTMEEFIDSIMEDPD
ncbi:MAG: hypothetical protein LBI75_07510 [Brucellaceae bacterium]|jgi:hypothetical protein|nr:hypothetical protein [Brucellaceae bacterium]